MRYNKADGRCDAIDRFFHLNKEFFKVPLDLDGILLYQIGRAYLKPSTVIGKHLHPDLFELTVVTSGVGRIITNGTETEVRRGDIYLSFPHDTHAIVSDALDPLKYDYIAFHTRLPRFSEELLSIAREKAAPDARLFRNERIGVIISQVISELYGDKLYSDEMPLLLMRELLILLIRNFRPKNEDTKKSFQDADALCYRMMHYIDTHLCSMRQVGELAEVFDYSYGYLSAVFKKQTSNTLAHYFLEKRLELAGELLLEAGHTVTAVAERLNYSSLYAFSKAFRAYFGVSPREYRRCQSRQ